MINTVLIHDNNTEAKDLVSKLEVLCPCIQIKGVAETTQEAIELLEQKVPDLAIVKPKLFDEKLLYKKKDLEWIFVSHTPMHAMDAIHCQASAYLLKPIEDHKLIASIEVVRKKIGAKKEQQKNQLLLNKIMNGKKASELVGIPTIEGFEFVHTDEIIRCEGLQKCTRVITRHRTDIISSYNIGEFRKLLEPYGFFSPHKSHLINLACIQTYKREGSIILQDNSYVPVAKRRKSEFIKQITHL